MTYKHTRYASYLGYVVQAIVNNLAPLLFVTFVNEFRISLELISLLIGINLEHRLSRILLQQNILMS